MAHRTYTHRERERERERKAKETDYIKREGIYKSTMACIAQL